MKVRKQKIAGDKRLYHFVRHNENSSTMGWVYFFNKTQVISLTRKNKYGTKICKRARRKFWLNYQF